MRRERRRRDQHVVASREGSAAEGQRRLAQLHRVVRAAQHRRANQGDNARVKLKPEVDRARAHNVAKSHLHSEHRLRHHRACWTTRVHEATCRAAACERKTGAVVSHPRWKRHQGDDARVRHAAHGELDRRDPIHRRKGFLPQRKRASVVTARQLRVAARGLAAAPATISDPQPRRRAGDVWAVVFVVQHVHNADRAVRSRPPTRFQLVGEVERRSRHHRTNALCSLHHTVCRRKRRAERVVAERERVLLWVAVRWAVKRRRLLGHHQRRRGQASRCAAGGPVRRTRVDARLKHAKPRGDGAHEGKRGRRRRRRSGGRRG